VVVTNLEEPLELKGTGTITPPAGAKEVTRGDVTVATASDIVAVGLRIETRLTMAANSSLRAGEGNKIELAHKTVDIEFSSVGAGAGAGLPTLDLGEIGDNYNILPKSLTVNPPTGLKAEELGGFSHTLISGDTLSNCEEWLDILDLRSDSFKSECVSGTGGGLLAGVRSLVIKGIPPPGPSGEPDLLLIAIIAGVAVVIVTIAIGVYLVRRKKNKKNASSSSYSYSYSASGGASKRL
jgi:hypothetical protein